jgi:hypothetical protein
MSDSRSSVPIVLNLDTSRAPGRPSELLALVLAVRGADAADESTWLEWKSTLDFRSGKSARVHVARAILGLANRMPDDAARHMEGHGFLVVGAEPGSVQGVATFDPVDLDQQVTPFVGDDGPRWHPTFLTIDDKTVLIIDIDPPRWGDPIHAARKSSDGITDGWVLVRGKGGTKQASSAQMAGLQRRLQATAADALAIAIEIAQPAAVTPIQLDAEEWLNSQELRLLRALPNPSGLDVLTAATRLGGLGASVMFRDLPEDRSEEQYRAQIARYIDLCRQRLPRVLAIAASRALTPLVLRTQNLTAKNLPDLVVELHVDGAVEAMTPRSVAIDEADRLPRPPRAWGPRKNPALNPLGSYGLPALPALLPSSYIPRPQPHIENGGSTDIRFPAVDLRPHRPATLDPVVLLVSEPQESVLRASWSATSSGADGTATGELVIPVDDTPWTVRDWAEQDDD